ncbi:MULTISPECIES: hypothetical protein [unclassified Methylobacterium]|uniref:hypothetical protein n=1 Tax=unclassified Methylobacterium TaxID=2615210 RepID=UPI0009EB9A63|nr:MULTISPECIES: hypothetical protein [unclassified Methylobacterium]
MRPSHAVAPRPRRPLRLRHKLMLLVAFEILVAGFTQAGMKPYRPGVAVELPGNPDHEIV